MSKIRFFPAVIVIFTVFVTGILTATLGVNLFDQGHKVGTDIQASSSEILQAPSESARLEWEEAFIDVAEAVNPAVVQIRSNEKIEGNVNRNIWEGTPWEQVSNMNLGLWSIIPNSLIQEHYASLYKAQYVN